MGKQNVCLGRAQMQRESAAALVCPWRGWLVGPCGNAAEASRLRGTALEFGRTAAPLPQLRIFKCEFERIKLHSQGRTGSERPREALDLLAEAARVLRRCDGSLSGCRQLTFSRTGPCLRLFFCILPAETPHLKLGFERKSLQTHGSTSDMLP